ncbi:hypothetical protein [Duganella sp. HH105]|uniref:hypothetical protein n=1 Tax=Duganella sp. HH105 TaxID=1781067 RepID=UPI000893A541|nr:hypothetical protein [Duganella sp. HH105]OEZ63185.1 hypothetical protein DUGA6_09810 [Duganella sp. HH105]
MTTMPAISSITPTTAATTLEDVINFIAKSGIDNPAIWSHLDRTNTVIVNKLLIELDAAESETYDKAVHTTVTKAQFEALKSGKKGKVFENLTIELMAGLTCFGVRSDVTTDVNQLDLLVSLEPNSSIVPALRNWGSHIICECKFHDTGVSVTWVEKLHSILRTHKAKVGILISKKGISKVGRGASVVHLLHMLAVDNCHVICLSREDLNNCAAKGGLLKLLVDRYVAIGNGIPQFMKEKIAA